MKRTAFLESCLVIGQCTLNWMARRPLVVSFEVTNSCTCWCRHCDHGGPADEPDLTPDGIRHWSRKLRPGAIQISGGEPLMRDDIVECVAAAQRFGGLPYTIFVSNWSLMTPEKYLALKSAGADQFSVSLDFPDKRHDSFRGHPGLYDHLDTVMPEIAALGFDDVVLNTAITSENYTHIHDIIDQAEKWGVNVSFSAYSARRTGDMSLMLTEPEQHAILRVQLDRLHERRESNGSIRIVNSRTTIEEMYRYFVDGGMPNCSSGLRFLVVTADGELQPCSMQFSKFSDQPTMVKEFTEHNTCDECYVAIRSYLDKSYWRLAAENIGDHFSFKRQRQVDEGASGETRLDALQVGEQPADGTRIDAASDDAQDVDAQPVGER